MKKNKYIMNLVCPICAQPIQAQVKSETNGIFGKAKLDCKIVDYTKEAIDKYKNTLRKLSHE